MVYTGGDPVVSEIRDCYNEGAVTSPRNAGGIAGVMSAVLSSDQTGTATSGVYSCYSSAEIAGDVAAGAISPSLSKMNYAGEDNGSVKYPKKEFGFKTQTVFLAFIGSLSLLLSQRRFPSPSKTRMGQFSIP